MTEEWVKGGGEPTLILHPKPGEQKYPKLLSDTKTRGVNRLQAALSLEKQKLLLRCRGLLKKLKLILAQESARKYI